MKMMRLGAVSLLAMGLAAGIASAQEEPVAQPEAQIDVAATEVPAEVLAILNDQRPLSELDIKELRQRLRAVRGFAKQQGLSDDVRATLQTIAEATRAELEAREKSAQEAPAPAEQPVQEAQPEQPVVEPAPAPVQEAQPETPAVEAAPEPVQEAAPEPAPEPVQQVPAAPVQEAAPEPAPEKTIEQLSTEEQPAAETAPEQPADVTVMTPKVEPADQQLDSNAVSPETENKAKLLLADETPADSLDDDALRARLDTIRDLMADNTLSPETEQALRKKLRVERGILRKRVALRKEQEEQKKLEEAAAEQPAPVVKKDTKPAATSKPPRTAEPQITIETPRERVLEDRRSSEELADSELRLRVAIFIQFELDPGYSAFDEDTRRYWRETVRRDRAILRARLAEERRRRAEELAANADEGIDVEVTIASNGRAVESVFEAEADDDELEGVLVSAPKRKFERRVTVEEIAEDEVLRDSMPRIDIDTIRFGFNEAFVREEEIDNLDRVASIIERVLRRNPREVFLIEGHTDAVGSNTYNYGLSKARAEAVKKALTAYFVIPARNLKTVGLGERYLRIPTSEAEAENRRVSVSRATPLIGEAAAQ